MIELRVDGAPLRWDNDTESLVAALRRVAPQARAEACKPLGSCMHCTIIVDGMPALACTLPATKLAGKSITVLDQGAASLVEYSGPHLGRRHPLEPRNLALGRSPENDLALRSSSVSRLHAWIEMGAGAERILADLGSANGTYVNGERLSGPRALRNGDVVMFGSMLMKYWASANLESAVQDMFYKAATTDALTLLYNRQRFLSLASSELEWCAAGARACALLLLDLDHFKRVNDRYGHRAGDEVLVTAARAIRDVVGDDGIVGRIGGEEVGVFLPDAELPAAVAVGEKVRVAISALQFSFAPLQAPDAAEPHTQTASIGAAAATPGAALDAVLHNADTLLYEAKGKGRNRVVS